MKTNPFNQALYDSCLTEDCPRRTQHKSGYCESCRTLKCSICDEIFIASNDFDLKRPRCGYCKCKGKRRE